MFRSILLVSLFLATCVPSAFAQVSTATDPISLLISPLYPQPYQSFTVSPRSSLINLTGSTVRVSVNGTQVYEGSGTAPTTVRAGGLGERTAVTVTVIDPEGKTYTKQQIIRPAEVSLVTESGSTAHPFYKGGSLVASEGRLRLIALTDFRSAPGTRLSSQNLVYTWRLGNQILTDSSGIGRSVLTATAPVRYRNADVTVTVTSQDQTLVGEARTVISPVDPVARVYQNDPLLGPNFDVALMNRFAMADTESTFRAVGYFFKVPPTFAWTVNRVSGGADRDVTVRSTGSGQGTARLGVTVTEPETRTNATTGLTVDFGASTGFGFFGL